MAYPKVLTQAGILKTATSMVDHDGPGALSLRAVAAALGVKDSRASIAISRTRKRWKSRSRKRFGK